LFVALKAGVSFRGERVAVSGDDVVRFRGSLVLVVRGVRMWLGHVGEGAGDQSGPLREVRYLCGLTLGGDDGADDREVGLRDLAEVPQSGQGLRLATFLGHRIQGDDGGCEGVAMGQGLGKKATRQRSLP